MEEESEWRLSYSHNPIVEGGFERSSNEKINAARLAATLNRLLIQGALAGGVLVT
jgi:hypothetical protein